MWRLMSDQNASYQLSPAGVHLQPFRVFRGPGHFISNQISCIGNGIFYAGPVSGVTETEAFDR